MKPFELKRRSWFGRLLQVPKAFRSHYTILRKTNGRRESIIAAWRLALLLIVPMEKPVTIKYADLVDMWNAMDRQYKPDSVLLDEWIAHKPEVFTALGPFTTSDDDK